MECIILQCLADEACPHQKEELSNECQIKVFYIIRIPLGTNSKTLQILNKYRMYEHKVSI